MNVTNNTSRTIEVAIDQWGTGGDTGFCTLEPGEKGHWERTDERGFLMVLKRPASTLTYFIQAYDEIIVDDNNVTDNGRVIHPIADAARASK